MYTFNIEINNQWNEQTKFFQVTKANVLPAIGHLITGLDDQKTRFVVTNIVHDYSKAHVITVEVTQESW